jgi:hypothetical protein
MAGPIPTQRDDILILHTKTAYTVYVVGKVTQDGQQDFHGQTDAQYLHDRLAAVAAAKTLVTPQRRIFLLDIDTGQWSEITGG